MEQAVRHKYGILTVEPSPPTASDIGQKFCNFLILGRRIIFGTFQMVSGTVFRANSDHITNQLSIIVKNHHEPKRLFFQQHPKTAVYSK